MLGLSSLEPQLEGNEAAPRLRSRRPPDVRFPTPAQMSCLVDCHWLGLIGATTLLLNAFFLIVRLVAQAATAPRPHLYLSSTTQ